jgi:hypothetical protein
MFSELGVQLKSSLIFIISTLLSLQCLADSNSHWDKAEEFINLSEFKKLVSSQLNQLEEDVEKTTADMYLGLTTEYSMGPEIQVPLSEYETEAKKVLRQIFSVKDMSQEMITMHMAYFSEEELDEIIKFYRSPVGSKFIEKQQTMLIHSQEIAQERLNEYFIAIKPIQEKLDKQLGFTK